MLKKELSDVIKQTAIFLAAVGILPAALLMLRVVSRQPYIAVFFPTYQAGLLFWALFLGASLLIRERDQRALEYFFSLPYSRLKLMVMKILPRLAVLAVLVLLFCLLYQTYGSSYAAMEIWDFTICLTLLFVISVCLSPVIENFLVLALLTPLVAAACWIVIVTMPWLRITASYVPIPWTAKASRAVSETFFMGKWGWLLFWIEAIILLLSFILGFIKTVRKFDVKSGGRHGRRFASIFIPAALVAAGLSYLVSGAAVPSGIREYFLTQDHKLLQLGYRTCMIYDKSHPLKIRLNQPRTHVRGFLKGKLRLS